MGRIFSSALFVGGLVSRYVGGAIDQLRRPCRDAVWLAHRRRGSCRRLSMRKAPTPISLRGLDGARRRHGGVALRPGFRHARPHFRRRRARADHDADAGRRLCVDGKLAGDAILDRRRRLARHLPGLRRIARRDRRAIARVRPAARPRREQATQRRGRGQGASIRAGAGPRLRAGRRRALPPTPSMPSALSAQLLAVFQRFGLSAGDRGRDRSMLFGPSQVLARIFELAFARRLHPWWVARGAVGLLVAAFVLLALLPFLGRLGRGHSR